MSRKATRVILPDGPVRGGTYGNMKLDGDGEKETTYG